jgi:hypothetical protein
VITIGSTTLRGTGGRGREQAAVDKKSNLILRNESGVALVIALLMIVVLSLIGLASSSNSTFEIKLSGNKKGSTEAFYMADAGVQMVKANITNFNTTNGFYQDIAGDQDSQEHEFKNDKPELIGEIVDKKYTSPQYSLPTGVSLTDPSQVTIYHTAVTKTPRGVGMSAVNFEYTYYIIDSTGREQMDLSLYRSNSIIREKIVRVLPTMQGGY